MTARFLTGDVIAGLLCVGVSIFLFLVAGDLPKSALVPIGPDFYPRATLGVTALFGAALALAGVLAGRSPKPRPARHRNYRIVLAAFAIFFLYVILLPPLGFRVATVLFVAALQAAIEPPRTPRRWGIVAAVALVTSAVTYVLFERYLLVLLPRGAWTGF